MRLGTPTCLICGYVIYKAPHFPPWVGEFRAISRNRRNGQFFICGVGCHDDPWGFIMSAPVQQADRWDNSTAPHGLIIFAKEAPVFHDQCWVLLNKYFKMDSSHLQRLFELVCSLPNPSRCGTLSWGHGYNGLVKIDKENCYPWEDPYIDLIRHEYDALRPHSEYSADPLYSGKLFSNIPLLFSNSPAPIDYPNPSHDPFGKLPNEILDEIISILPTSDYLSARKASRAFYYQFYGRLSWERRPKEDRPWLYEIQETSTTEWRSLYLKSNGQHLRAFLKNRRRIWNLLPTLIACSSLRLTEPPLAATDHQFRLTVDAEIFTRQHQSLSEFERGCQRFYSQAFYLPRYVSAISAYLVPLGDSDYICGLKIFDQYGAEEEVGYSSPKESELVNIEEHSIQGFILAVGNRGIQGMRIVKLNGIISQWLGDPSDCPKTERLYFRRRIDACKVGYDGCKLVFFAVPGDIPTHLKTLASSALWYPKIPPPTMLLNEHLIPQGDSFQTRYLPLFWTHFGGPSGSNLGSLTGISCIFGHHYLERIEFSYNTPQTSSETSLGRGILANWPKRLRFSIDGPRGERIVAIETFYERSIHLSFTDSSMNTIQSPYLCAFRATTNWNRTCLFLDQRDTTHGLWKYEIRAEGNTAITGLYSSQKPDMVMALTVLGVMTEVVEN